MCSSAHGRGFPVSRFDPQLENFDTTCWIPPPPLLWQGAGSITVRNRIVHDERAREVLRFEDPTGVLLPTGVRSGWYERGAPNPTGVLGHEWLACVTEGVSRPPREPTTAPRPSLPEGARVMEGARGAQKSYLKFAHLDGPDQVAAFVEQHLKPMLGPRPTAQY